MYEVSSHSTMQVDAPDGGQEFLKMATEQALAFIEQPEETGGFLSHHALVTKLGHKIRSRVSFDIVQPELYFHNERVMIRRPNEGPPIELFHLNVPLIEQLIHLKPFFVPENVGFFVSWIRQIGARCDDVLGRQLLFGASDGAELWFGQRNLPTVDMSNPLPGALHMLNMVRK